MTFAPPDESADRGAAFGDARQRRRTSQELSFASFDVATIRFVRAVEALVAQRHDDVEKWLRRAASMPYDTFEGLHPALAAATMTLHDLVHDAMEATAPDASDDSEDPEQVGWLRAAQLAVDRAGEAPYLMGTLADIQQDYELLPREVRALKELQDAHPSLKPPFGTPELSTDDVMALLRAVAADAVAYGQSCTALDLPITRG